jgi:hypothetical protein
MELDSLRSADVRRFRSGDRSFGTATATPHVTRDRDLAGLSPFAE